MRSPPQLWQPAGTRSSRPALAAEMVGVLAATLVTHQFFREGARSVLAVSTRRSAVSREMKRLTPSL